MQRGARVGLFLVVGTILGVLVFTFWPSPLAIVGGAALGILVGAIRELQAK
ncbi:MAG: hypothetical protein PHD88_09390 [Firmicutes bacterium]|nr:hypothetical protein [Bacillota bacterium]MDD4264479.1 hypothetical protein [Bacillota bacterium]MDD4694586.1 hypothetical protein [Bacillota bacterium]